jgi:hypothetical protein
MFNVICVVHTNDNHIGWEYRGEDGKYLRYLSIVYRQYKKLKVYLDDEIYLASLVLV